MLVVGLTGDVGAGKSTVARIWKEMGAAVIDADVIAKELWTEPDVLDQAVSRWGRGILDNTGKLLPSSVASIIFENPDEYHWLCELLHPLVRTRMEKYVERSEGWIVAEIPLLYEGGIPWWVDMVIYVAAPENIRMKRNTHRNWDMEEIKRRESCLLPRQDKIGRAHLLITNSGTLECLRNHLTDIAEQLKSMASLTEIFLRCTDIENGRRIGSLLSADNLVTDLSLTRAAGLRDQDDNILLSGFCRTNKLPKIREMLRVQNISYGPLWIHPVRHMDLPNLRRLSGDLIR